MKQVLFRRLITTGSNKAHLIGKPKFDIKGILENLSKYEHSIKSRELVNEQKLLNDLKNLPAQSLQIKGLNKDINEIQQVRKNLESQIKENKDKLNELLPSIKSLKEQYQEKTETLTKVSNSMDDVLSSLPNLLNSTAPLNGSPEVVHWINKPETEPQADPERAHVEIMKRKNMIDLQSASTTTGTSSYYLLNEGAQLELALINYAVDTARKHGFNFIIPPSLSRLGIIDACGFRPRDMNGEKQIYAIEGQDTGLVATAEITLAALGYNKIMSLGESGIKKVVGLSRCYRAEAGARGKDTKGLYRVHEFSKVELFCWSEPKFSNEVLESLKNFQIELFTNLGLYAKVINMPSNDLGNPAYNKYDIEAWMPGRGSFGEVSSTSNCTDYQSRRLNTRFKNSNGNLEYVHSINGTAMAVPRVLLALVENNYIKETDKIGIPQPLISYMGGKKYI
ncbi:similar to Saccharomyces cerevisiae YHR011W DIA4 Probable mitochondrial seryl-tRNA synthetase, mutant displays increased invasive and pseudohyphal growth [Maudiozyma barnettii]|uniref:serine--tRNA ligase n=1 Tax=Maudiozyma barnettii TaxID=61262 RepID=A0A8H2VIH6_9SACH|nr:putative serine--tRNA ligase DIA4 [Kazachstania barnettii]CAB4256316.1 similar to Saccharomyces cerevisiae YHR011W DIA4 Probable mitochondrial seryl-tRNA synthetase, mutant displays increased invasive and pseudohyphal growth [Kazachstania barnettii]CAD1784925.1 similar to Saccharomyces cerevisiae YHR011W DIA4 Probable mitochondrial seryl-tRNA synthetase, mutant displays increased invasive and pseudohyphal growth [Kazachstania barnettii]